jgi:hypothetical protein
MGGASSTSKASILNPFPIDSKQSNDLDLLSYVAARILSTPDIYDINNLARPGVCGDYAVFLKKDLEKKLMNFIADVDGVPTDVVYQNPNKAIDKIEVRKKICSDMVDALLRAIATIVACLASIQVASPSGWPDSRCPLPEARPPASPPRAAPGLLGRPPALACRPVRPADEPTRRPSSAPDAAGDR